MLSCTEVRTGDATSAMVRGIVKREASSLDGVLAIFSDRVWGGTREEFLAFTDEERADHLLEARIYGRLGELRMLRSDLGQNFRWRLALDACDVGERDWREHWFDEVHYLDIDAKYRSIGDGRDYKSMSGGTYRLPIEGAERVVIRNYIEYDEVGLAHIEDFRIVTLLRRNEKWA